MHVKALAHFHLSICIFFLKKNILNISLCIHILILYKRVRVSLQPALFELHLFSYLLLHYCNISTHMCTIVHNVAPQCWVHVSVCVHATVTTVIDRSPCRASSNVEKGNRQWERQWGGLEGRPNYTVLHLLHLTLRICRSKSFLLLHTTKNFWELWYSQIFTEDYDSLKGTPVLNIGHCLPYTFKHPHTFFLTF